MQTRERQFFKEGRLRAAAREFQPTGDEMCASFIQTGGSIALGKFSEKLGPTN